MIEWVDTIFYDNSDKAKFITVFFSALVAVSVIILTQLFISRRERKQLLIEKVEEIYVALLFYQKFGIEYLALISNFSEDYSDEEEQQSTYKQLKEQQSTYEKVINSGQTVTMLMELYFSYIPSQDYDVEGIIKVLVEKMEYKSEKGDTPFGLFADIRGEFLEKIENMKKVCRKLAYDI